MATSDVPDIVIGRLPIYLRALTLLQKAGEEITSSQELGQRLGIGSAQIRKDLSHFGEFGKQGTGYEVSYLREQIAKILHVDRAWTLALIGFGDLGQAILHYGGFHRKGFHIEAILDNDPDKIGQEVEGKTIQSLDDLEVIVSAQNIKIAILAVPAGAAQEVANKLIGVGIKAILNYAPITLNVPNTIQVQYIDPIMHLQRMVYYLE
jgi:redox-sensing transcriptional repressor